MKQKTFALLLALVLTFSLLPVSGAAAHTETVYLKTKESEYSNDALQSYTLFTYDTNGTLVKEDLWARDSEAGEFDSHTQRVFTYNSQGDLTSDEWIKNDKTSKIYEYQFTYGEQYTKREVYVRPIYISPDAREYHGYHETYYDASGNEGTILHYDEHNKLKSSQKYAYDPHGNRISETNYSYNDSGDATQISQTRYEYDTENRLTREYNPKHPEEVWRKYSYNEKNQLIKMEYSQTNGPDNGSVYPFTTDYAYDEHGNLISETTTIRSRSRENPFVIHTSILRVVYEYQAYEIPVPPPFEDVEPDGYYRDAVEWAVENGVTTGTSKTTFSPNKACTRAEAVTFLWRAKGEPEPKSASNPFVDVKADDYFYKAVLWAVEQGITNGMDKTHFGPEVACTRAHVVTFLWRSHNKPAAGPSNPFSDVPANEYYTDAGLWAVKEKITNGMGATHFGPDNTCIRGQIVTFLYRDLAK